MDLLRHLANPFELKPLRDSEGFSGFSKHLDLAFGVPAGGRFLDDFPVWDEINKQPTVYRVGVFTHARNSLRPVLVGCAASRVAQMKASGGSVPVGIIGAVATHPEWRGQGVATRLIQHLLREFDAKSGASKVKFTVLWGSEHRFYGKFGFSLSGEQWVIPLSKIRLPQAAFSNEIGRGWQPALFECLQRRSLGLELNSEDKVWVQSHKNVQWYWLGKRESPTAYAALGRGIDLTGLIHEWGGESGELKRLLAALARVHPEAALLGSPKLLKDFELDPLYSPKSEGLCLARGLIPATPELPLWFWGLDGA